MNSKNLDKIKKMTAEEKASLLSGKDNWHTAEIDRLEIDSVTFHDGPHGVRIEGVQNTIYPNFCLLGCSFDKNALKMIGRLIGNDCIKNNVDVLLAPGMNIKRSPVGGRNFEYFSEDSYLSGELACAYVKGLQSTGTSATVKHFCCNNTENYRMSTSVEVDTEVLFNTYLKAFYKVIRQAKPDCIMTSYNRVNGEKTNESSFLQKEVLREKFGFDGLIMSDWGAVTDKIKAVKSGCDLEMPGGNCAIDKALAIETENDRELEKAVNASVDRVLSLCDKHLQQREYFEYEKEEIVSDIISESIVMLKNENSILPLKKGELIGVYGDEACSPVIQGGGCACIKAGNIISPRTELEKYYNTVYVPTDGDISCLKTVDKILVFISSEYYDSEAYDRAGIELNLKELAIAKEIYKQNKNIIMVLQNGGMVNLSDIPCAAILECYYGGEFFAKGLIKILNGKSPCGRLAESFIERIEDSSCYLGEFNKKRIIYSEGNFVGYKYYEAKKHKVVYPFGYGLSYAEICYKDFKLYESTISEKKPLKGYVKLENKSNITAKEVIQLYCKRGREKQLVYIDKVEVPARSSMVVQFSVESFEFSRYDGEKYSLQDENAMIVLSKNARDDIFSLPVIIQSDKRIEITQDMLIEDVFNLVGGEAVKRYFSRPLGIAMYNDENYILPVCGKKISYNEFEHKTSMMMPLTNLVAFSGGKYTYEDLSHAIYELNTILSEKQ